MGLPGFEPESRAPEAFHQRLQYWNCEGFKDFCLIDLGLAESTSNRHIYRIQRFLKMMNKDPKEITKLDVRIYLKMVKETGASSTYKNVLATLKRFFRDFLGLNNVVDSFKYPPRHFTPIIAPSKDDLRRFYRALTSDRDRALFLVYASSGLRCSEVVNLQFMDVDFEKRMLLPKKRENRSKHVWVSFYNAEAEHALKNYVASRDDSESRLFTLSREHASRTFRKPSRNTGVTITPQRLRDWFCCEMGRLGVPDRYVDAFCGRVPGSILARHYTDYSPSRLKEIYDKADLKVLS